MAAACALTPLAAPGPAAVTVASAVAGGRVGDAGVGGGRAGDAGVGVKAVRYLGRKFLVPRGWPVVRNLAHPHGCVRFDQHAVYLGAAPAGQECPSWLLGTTEALLIQRGPAAAASYSAEYPVARQIVARAPGISVFATFDADPSAIYRILASAGLAAPVIRVASPAGPAAALGAGEPAGSGRSGGGMARLAGTGRRRSPAMRRPMAAPPLPDAVAGYRGLGFDACTAPSRRIMRAWRRRSPYRAIGIYIGGADRACAQPNLSEAWVRSQAHAGWHFMPLYAGPQAAFGEIHAPVRQGRAAAADAAFRMRRLGFGRRTLVYYDMEAFGNKSEVAVLRFLSAWTRELHRLGYESGVYSSSDSGIVDLSRQYARHVYAMPNVIYDALWNGSATTSDRNLRAGQWHDKRIHQFAGNVTQRFGGQAVNIDKDVLDVRLRAPAVTAQPTSAVTLPDGSVDVFYRARGARLWLDRYVPGRGWAAPVQTGAVALSAPSVVWTGSAVDAFYKGSGGYLGEVSAAPGGALTGRRVLTLMGVLGSAPRAVAQQGGVIDVFWRGSADDHLWHGQYTPGAGWNGPQGLGGSLRSGPAPVVSSPGTTTVLWQGTDRALWYVARGLLGSWSAPRSLGMGPLGGQPLATAQPGGGIQVYWHGSGNAKVWEAFRRPGGGWGGPRDLGGLVTSAPWPVTAGGTVRVLWRGPGHVLTYIRHRRGDGWDLSGWASPAPLRRGWLGGGPFAAVGNPAAPLRVFWQGRHGSLWTASLGRGRWSAPTRLAG